MEPYPHRGSPRCGRISLASTPPAVLVSHDDVGCRGAGGLRAEEEDGEVVGQVMAVVEAARGGSQFSGRVVGRVMRVAGEDRCDAFGAEQIRAVPGLDQAVGEHAEEVAAVEYHAGVVEVGCLEQAQSVPSRPTGSTVSPPRSTSGGWCPARQTVSSIPEPFGRATA